MVHAIKDQADVHRVPDFQVTAEELEGISLSQTEPDFTHGINPDEFSREPGNDSLVEDLDLILTGASPMRTKPTISRDRCVQHAPPRSGDPAIEILPTPTLRVASVTPILKACDTPRRAKGLKFIRKSPSIVKRLFTETESENTPEPNQEAERPRRERGRPVRALFKRRFPQRRFNGDVSNREVRPERFRRPRIPQPLCRCRDGGLLRLAKITSDFIRDLIRDYSATFSNTYEKVLIEMF
ncbi:hypothetical protein KOW79_015919 [Hemibagrus wyckioides]|uniref:Uncharacterized protein n=2 Tax=Hemibagrus wyckioides TaxID=337641 RepID=A0A9D3NB32_9TELE|nr:hypothetical protein KOW79_015919 [Hemibagrus wyckioides]